MAARMYSHKTVKWFFIAFFFKQLPVTADNHAESGDTDPQTMSLQDRKPKQCDVR